MKIAFIGDLHVGRIIRGHDRTPDILAAWRDGLRLARQAGATVLVQTGDVFDTSFPSPEETSLVIGMFRDAANYFDGVYTMPGNHDIRHGADRADALAPLRAADLPLVWCPTAPAAYGLCDEAALLMLPYESKSRRAWSTPEEYDAEIVSALKGNDRRRLVVVGHLDIEGALLSSEIPTRGGGQSWPVGRGWKHRVVHAVDGHLHRPQTVDWGSWTIHCVGTPVPMDFGEATEVKRVVIVEV